MDLALPHLPVRGPAGIARAGSGGSQFGLQQVCGERPAGSFVLVAAAAASKVAMRQVEQRISETLGTPQYQQMRRNLAAIAELDLPMTTS